MIPLRQGYGGHGASVTTLPSGLRIATDRMETVESVSLGVWVGVGTRHEPPEINGVAHLLEHMAFKGTHRRSAKAIAEEIEAVGGQLNAYTSRESTAYYAKVLKDDVPLALDILADIVQHATLDPEELARERTVVLQEIGQAYDTPDDIIFDHFQATAYPSQPLGMPVLGTSEIVAGLPREAIAGYLGKYGAERMVLAAAGRVDHETLVGLAERHFGELAAGAADGQSPSRYVGGEYREESDLEQLHLVLGFQGVGLHDRDFYAEAVLSTLLGGGMSSRLFQEIREKRGLVYSIHTFSSHYEDGGLFGVYAGTGEKEVAELVPVLCDELARAADSFTDAEVDRARAQLKASLLMGLESTMARAEQLASQLLVFGRQLTVPELVAKVEAVDKAALGRVARRLLSSPPTVASLGPTGRLESYDRIAARLG